MQSHTTPSHKDPFQPPHGTHKILSFVKSILTSNRKTSLKSLFSYKRYSPFNFIAPKKILPNENKANDEATVFVQTFPEKGGPGHTSAYVVGPKGETFSISLFPSSKYNRHLLQAYLKIPVEGFNTKGPMNDVRYEQGPAYSILEIKASYSLLKKAHEKYLAALQTNIYFSLNYHSTSNIFQLFLQHDVRPGGFDPIIERYPTSDDLLIIRPKEAVCFMNCTKAVETSLKHAGFFKETRDENQSLTPKEFQAELVALGAIERVNDLSKLPTLLKESQLKGKEIERDRPTSTRETMENFRQHLSILG